MRSDVRARVYETSPTKPTSGETKVIDQIGDRSRPTTDQCRPASAVERRTWHGCNRPPVPHAGLDARLPRRKPSDAEGNSSVVPRTAPVDPTRHWAPPSVVLAKTPRTLASKMNRRQTRRPCPLRLPRSSSCLGPAPSPARTPRASLSSRRGSRSGELRMSAPLSRRMWRC